MAEAIDLKTFKPNNAEEFVQGLISHVVASLGKSWKEAANELKSDLAEYGLAGFRILNRLRSGEIDRKKADALLHMQELYLNQILLNAEFWPYVTAQRALNAATSIVKAAIKNITGVSLNF